MGELVFWVGSIIETIVFNNLNSRKIYKDLADKGFKVKIIDDGKIDFQDTPTYLQFIPFINILTTAQYIMKYNASIDEAIFYLQCEHLLLPLTETEKKLYKLNPTAKTAMNIAKEDYLTRKYGNSIVVQGNLEDTKIVYYYNFETFEIEVLSCTGPLARLSREDLDELISTILEVNLQERYDYYGGDWGYYHAVMDGKEKPTRIIVKESDYMIDEILENGLGNHLKTSSPKEKFIGRVLNLKPRKKKDRKGYGK